MTRDRDASTTRDDNVSRDGDIRASASTKKFLNDSGLSHVFSLIISFVKNYASAKTHNHDGATTTQAGFMSANDKVKLNGVADGANRTIVDSALSGTSVNPVQNKVVKTALDGKAPASHVHPTSQITGLDSALAGKASASHKHSADDITSGVLSVGRGGTGASSSKGAQYNIMKDILEGTVNASDTDVFVLKHHTPSATDGALLTRSAAQVWAWIKSKCDGLYQPRGSYASSSHTHTIANVSNLQSSLDSKASVSHTHSNATSTASGFMSNADKAKLDGVSAGANKTIVDSSFSATSPNPVQNKVVKAALDGKASSSHTHTTAQVTGLDAALAGKASTSHNHSGVYAPVSHNHDAGNITSGTLPIHRGGTGGTNRASAANSLGVYGLYDKTSIPANADLNTYKTAGTYVMTTDVNAATLKNCPTGGSSFTLWVDYILSSTTYIVQKIQRYNDGIMYHRESVNSGSSWNVWKVVLDSNNYNVYAPTKTGGGASGTWGINVTGSAGSVPWSGVTGKPSTFAPSSHSHDWGSITGKPSTFTPSSHTHTIANITNLQAQLDSKQPKGSYAAASHNHDSVYSKLNHTHSYLPLSGGSVTGQIKRTTSGSTSWVTGRNTATVRNSISGASQYEPILSAKTENGSWELGTYVNNTMHLSYITDENYNKGNNTQTANIQFKPNNTIVANIQGNASSASSASTIKDAGDGRTLNLNYSANGMTSATWFAAWDGNTLKSIHKDTVRNVIGAASLLSAYPVGAVYISWSSTSPASLFGGSWTAITGRFPYFNAGTSVGGANTHTLSVHELASHNHTYWGTQNGAWLAFNGAAGQSAENVKFGYVPAGQGCIRADTSNFRACDITSVGNGGNGPHNNMPSYQTLYAWRRTG